VPLRGSVPNHLPRFQGVLTTMDALVGFASLLAKRGEHQKALQLLLICLDHSSTVAETIVRAEKLTAEVKEKLTPQEIESVKVLGENYSLESVVQEILGPVQKTAESE
jgi:hypothetical protein